MAPADLAADRMSDVFVVDPEAGCCWLDFICFIRELALCDGTTGDIMPDDWALPPPL